MARLVVRTGPHRGMSFALAGERLSVGRDFSNHVQIPDSKASRHHAEVRLEESGWVVWDLGSSNGTYVGGKPVKRHALRDGDEIGIGGTVLGFVSEERGPEPRLERTLSTSEFSMETLAGAPNPLLTGEIAGSPEEVMRSASRLARLYELSRAAAAADTVAELFERTAELVEAALEADRCFAILLEGEGAAGERWTPHGRPPAARGSGRLARAAAEAPISMSVVETVKGQGRPLLTRAGEDERFRERPSVKLGEISSVLCVPLAARGAFLGVLYADRLAGGEGFSREDLEFLDAAASGAALAYEALRAREAVGRRAQALAREVKTEHAIVGESEAMRPVFEFIERASPVDAGVFILGESGTGRSSSPAPSTTAPAAPTAPSRS
jgi:adenylate cyclase